MLSVLAALLMQAAAPGASSAPPKPSVITQPDWLSKPTGADIAELYPKAAAAANIEGRATLRCHVAATGDLIDCAAVNEEPLGQGFGQAALAMAAKFKMRPMSKDGVPIAGGQVAIPIKFSLPKAQPQGLTAEYALRCYGYSAAAAEKDPSSEKAQSGAFVWRIVAEVMSAPEKLRPSEIEGRLSAARRMGETPAASDDGARADRAQCDAVVDLAGPKLQSLFEKLPH
jgi:TonB family protein